MYKSLPGPMVSLYTFARPGQSKFQDFFIKIYGSVTNSQPPCGILNPSAGAFSAGNAGNSAEGPVFLPRPGLDGMGKKRYDRHR